MTSIFNKIEGGKIVLLDCFIFIFGISTDNQENGVEYDNYYLRKGFISTDKNVRDTVQNTSSFSLGK